MNKKEECVKVIRQWVLRNFLLLNSDRAEIFLPNYRQLGVSFPMLWPFNYKMDSPWVLYTEHNGPDLNY